LAAQAITSAPVSITQVYINHLVKGIKRLFEDDLTGIYLHGSLAMGCFNPCASDVNVIVVTRQRLSVEVHYALERYLMRIAGKPYPVEVTVLFEGDIYPWRYPTPVEFHFGDDWNGPHTLAAQIMTLHKRGVCLVGREIEYTFPPVPMTDYIDAMVRDSKRALTTMMIAPAEAVLTMCRVYHALMEDAVSSKSEAGAWALRTLKPRHRDVLRASLDYYEGRTDVLPFDPIDLAQFIAYMDAHISHHVRGVP
jgi:streptomycin 3"-adenylyltransferase